MNKKAIGSFLVISAIMLFNWGELRAQSKLGQSGFQFISVVSDARAGALGTAMTTVSMGASALFFNPATMAKTQHFIEVNASQNQWFADINHIQFSASFRPANGRYGVFGISYQSVDYGDFQGTIVWNNERGYLDTEIFNPTAYALGAGYAKQLSDRFSIGGQVKLAKQYLGRSAIPVYDPGQGESSRVKKNLADVVAFDFGTIYRTELRGLNFGMSIRNFSKEIKYEKESFQLPLMFRIGFSVDAFEMLNIDHTGQNVLLTIDAVHPRSYPEYVNFGLEYAILNNALALRGGYTFNRDLEDVTFGFGIQKFGIAIDYSYTPFGLFDPVQRFTFRVAL